MPRSDSTTTTLVVAALVAGAIGLGVHNWSTLRGAPRAAITASKTSAKMAGLRAPPLSRSLRESRT